jgi:ribonuclease HI
MKSTITSRYSEYKKLKEKDAEYVYTIVDQLRMSNNTMYQIGERTHFIRLRQGKEMYEWKWDPTDENLPTNIKKLDELLTEAMQKRLD